MLLPSGVTRSALQALTVRTVKVCVTVLTGHAATTSTEAACASRASAVHTAGTGCVHPGNTACTVSAPACARTNTHSGERRVSEEEGNNGLKVHYGTFFRGS